ncbi:MAG: carbon-nitrogen hydrolase family protein [Opitutaceae bacterium]
MPRKVRIATVCQNYDVVASADENRDRLLRKAEALVSSRPDLICLPETFTWPYEGGSLNDLAETIPGPTTEVCADLARRANAHVICPLFSRDGPRFLNSAVILDRRGQIVGAYHKAQPVTSSHDYRTLENGVHPGPADLPVFDLDFGRIGIQICFDLIFPETWLQLAAKGAELVFWPSAYDGGRSLDHMAYQLKCPVISSSRGHRSRIIDPMGEVIAQTCESQHTALAMIDLDTVVCHLDFHPKIADELRATYGDRVSCRACQEEALLFIQSNDPDLPVAELVRLHGLERLDDYRERHRKTYAALRDGREPEAQDPPYRDRPQHR